MSELFNDNICQITLEENKLIFTINQSSVGIKKTIIGFSLATLLLYILFFSIVLRLSDNITERILLQFYLFLLIFLLFTIFLIFQKKFITITYFKIASFLLIILLPYFIFLMIPTEIILILTLIYFLLLGALATIVLTILILIINRNRIIKWEFNATSQEFSVKKYYKKRVYSKTFLQKKIRAIKSEGRIVRILYEKRKLDLYYHSNSIKNSDTIINIISSFLNIQKLK